VIVRALIIEIPVIALSGVLLLLFLAPAAAFLAPGLPRVAFLAGPVVGVIVITAAHIIGDTARRDLPRPLTDASSSQAVARLLHSLYVVGVNWALLGTGCFFLVVAAGPADVALWPSVIFVVTVAVLAGLVTMTPFGLGARDALLIVLLSQLMPESTAAAAALLHRMATIGADVAWAGVVLALAGSRSRRSG
jgi:uncharacterized membrane protein YbhN (UPF0104 family)